MRAGPDADRGDSDFTGYVTRKFTRDTFDDGSEGTCCIDTLCVLKNAISPFEVTSLNFVPTHSVIALWRQANVAHDGNVNSADGSDGVKHRRPTFEFDRRCSGLDELDCASDALLAVDVIRAEG
jgi:hypothetical protein